MRGVKEDVLLRAAQPLKTAAWAATPAEKAARTATGDGYSSN